MQAKEETLAVIREIAADGEVTDDEVIQLAVFLNENVEARTSWPGIAVYEVLRDVLADGQVDDFEREALIHVLSGIDIICAGAAVALEGETVFTAKPEEQVEYELTDFELPVMEISTVRDRLDDPLAVMRLAHHECRCSSWSKSRAEFPDRSPGRGCACVVDNLLGLAKADPRLVAQWPKQLLGLVKKASAGGKGFDAVGTWKLLTVGKTEVVLSKGKTDWCSVYVTNAEGKLEKFSYQFGHNRWGYGASPDCSKDLDPVFRSDLQSILDVERAD